MLRVFVSTMYSGEGDFEDSIKSVKKQKNVQVEHHIIYKQSELEAHQNQIKTWLAVQDRFDLYVKVDADSVITHDDAFISIWETMQKHSASAAQIRLHDYFTNTPINGLNFLTKESILTIPTDDIYPDRSVQHKKLIHSDEGMFDQRFVPIGVHCYYTNLKQAFHFGVHRGIKQRFNEYYQVKEAWQTLDHSMTGTGRHFAMLGFEQAKLFLPTKQFNYNDALFKKTFKDNLKKWIGTNA